MSPSCARSRRTTVHFLGYQSPLDLRALYRGARALITPSIAYEVFPLVILEAFQQGTPVIARRLGPYPEIIEASGGGLLFDDRTELETAIRSLVLDSPQRDAMAVSARQAFRLRWTETVAITAYLDLIRSVALRRGLHGVADALATSPAPNL
jgi:glycosyltransferase involved in cell wall biosynthesis